MSALLQELEKFSTSDPEAHERCGLILPEGYIVELPNTCEDPQAGFVISAEDMNDYIDDAWATWHTHPGTNSELSLEDIRSFEGFEGFRHFIIGQDGISVYVTKGGEVLND